MAKPKMSPGAHSKNAQTGLGATPRVPGNAKSAGPSNHNPKTGK